MKQDGDNGNPADQPEKNSKIESSKVVDIRDRLPQREWPEPTPEFEPEDMLEVEAPAPVQPQGKKASQADKMVELALPNCELFHSKDGEAFITVHEDGIAKTFKVKSRDTKFWLMKLLYTAEGITPNPTALNTAINALMGKALFDGEAHEVFLRYAYCEGRIYIDLGNAAYQQVEIDTDGRRIIESKDSPVRFVRKNGMAPMAAPADEGSFDPLGAFLNLETGDDAILISAWLLSAMNPRGPYPILAFVGEQGTAKSTMAKILKDLVDPSDIPLATLSRNERDLVIAAEASWMLCFNNISALSSELSDSLCRLATDGGLRIRALFTDSDEIHFKSIRPIILNGISDYVTRGDLASRSIIINPPTIQPGKRFSERELWQRWHEVKPVVFAAFCDALSAALRNIETTKLDQLPRMADFAQFVSAAESALPWAPGAFLRAYERNQAQLVDTALEADQVATAVTALIDKTERNQWAGTASELLAVLNERVDGNIRRLGTWPKKPNILSNRLRRLAPSLRTKGIKIEKGKSGERYISIRKQGAVIPELPSRPAEQKVAERPQEAAARADDNRTDLERRVRRDGALMGARELLRELQSRGIRIYPEGSDLRCRAPKGALTPDVATRIKDNKEEILRTLQEEVGLIPEGMGMTTLAEGDCLKVLRRMPSNSVDAMVTDPPYGYEFMGKDWDKAVPGVEIWKETHRVLKPGALAFVMCSPRQDVLSQMIINLAKAGFETGFTSLYWTYATGFTKAYNIGKAVAKKLSPEKAKELEGSYAGFQPKPAVEVILVVMKPIDKKTYSEQAITDGKGLTWMDHCRIPYAHELPVIGNRHRHDRGEGDGFKPAWKQNGGVVWAPEKQWKQDIERQAHEKGRFPANLLVSQDVLDDGRNHPGGTFPKRRGKTEYFGLDQLESGYVGRLNDSGGYSRFFSLDAWAE